MSFLRTYQQLLPRARAWQIVIDKTLRKFFEGLANSHTADLAYIDDVFDELHPDTTTQIEAWETHFGLQPATSASESDRRAALSAEWAATGGQSPSYIQGVLQTAGFDVYIHEWWSSGPGPYVARDPRLYTTDPLIGTYQCRADPAQPQCQELYTSGPECNAFLANEPGYIVNRVGVPIAPPPVPDDPDFWPYFLYFGGATFGTFAYVPNDRRAEFERLLLKLCPTQNWIVIGLIDFTTEGVFDDSFAVEFE